MDAQSTMSLDHPVPVEIWDRTIDHLHDCPTALAACRLVAKPWLPSAQYHLFDQNAIWWVARNGHERLMKLLLARGDVNINARDATGRTLLSWAAECGHTKLIDLLLAQPGISPHLSR